MAANHPGRHAAGPRLLQRHMPAGIAEDFAFAIAADAVDAAGAELFIANEGFAGPLTVGAHAGEPVRIDGKLPGEVGSQDVTQ